MNSNELNLNTADTRGYILWRSLYLIKDDVLRPYTVNHLKTALRKWSFEVKIQGRGWVRFTRADFPNGIEELAKKCIEDSFYKCTYTDICRADSGALITILLKFKMFSNVVNLLVY